jgi:hypothetical protein
VNLPRYAIVGACPVKILPKENGGMEVLAFDWETRDFAPDDGYFLEKVLTGLEGDVEYLTESEFEARVAALKRGE